MKETELTEIKEDVKENRTDIKLMLGNHLPHMSADIKETKTNVSWLMKFFWVVATASIGSLIAAVLTLILK